MANMNGGVVELLDLDEGVAQITMQDEESCNSFSQVLIEGLYHCFETVAQSDRYKVVILTGYGNYFASGGTKHELLGIQKGEIKFNDLDFFKLAIDCQIPVIAAMQGHGIGGGLILGLYADLVVLSAESIYTTNFMKYGFTPGLGATLIVPEKLGTVLGQEMMYTARNYRGEELAKRGVSFPVVPRKEVLNYARTLAKGIAEQTRLSLVTLKAHLTVPIKQKLPQWLEKETAMHEITFSQPEVLNRIEINFAENNNSRQKPINEQQTITSDLAAKKLEIPSANQPFQLKLSDYGLLNNLIFQPIKRRQPKPDEVEVEVTAVALNFRDLLNALGMLMEYNEKNLGITNIKDLTFGFECVGKILSIGRNVSNWNVGDEVMVIAIHDGFSSVIICHQQLLFAKPKYLSDVQAATIPIPFFTAYHGLYNLAKIQTGERVLIHAAAGGTGQAAVQLAKLINAEIFVTASPSKWDFLRQQGIKHIMNSRTLEFADEIMELTQGAGVNVIFNSLTQEGYISKNLKIMAQKGRLIEIGKIGIWNEKQVAQVRPDIQYFPFDLGEDFNYNNQLFNNIWKKLRQNFDHHQLQPLQHQVFAIEDVIQAFRYIQHSKNIGRVVITMPKINLIESDKEYESARFSQEQILSKLQLGDISIDEAEKLLLETDENEPQGVEINVNNSENILALLQSGEISLDNAEKLLEKIIDTPAEINDLISVHNTDIAVIGISCRYPGANNLQEFWENLKHGVDSVTEVPERRWLEKNWYHKDREHPNTAYSQWGGFLTDVDKFDPIFFHISPSEAKFIEPQQRIFLEEAYHAIEDAGYTTDFLKGKQCGVFVGAANSDYHKLLSLAGLATNRQALTGNILSMLPARIAYFLDLQGPVLAIDTACSSSLVAIHQACVSLQNGESELAIAGGINLLHTSNLQVLSSQFQMISPAGRCQTFDASASGTVWSEGCGVVILKRYDLAIQDGDRIYGIIKGSGVNYDGNTNGITAPSSHSQARLEKMIYEKFNINPETISYVEAHGTATYLGDPIEVEALTAAFSEYTTKKQYCAIGSVKTNIGHPAAAAGVAGFIKTILCLKNQQLVPSLHFHQPNPQIDFANSPFYVNTQLKNWQKPTHNQLRQAAVSSFGFSGTNAHIVLAEAPIIVTNKNPLPKNKCLLDPSSHILTISAKTAKSLADLVSRYYDHLHNNPEDALENICYTANTGRNHFHHRLAFVVSNQEELAEKLLSFPTEKEKIGIFSGQLPDSFTAPKIVFLFTGQGSQYVNMARELYDSQPLFRKILDQCHEILDIPLLEILYPETINAQTLSLIDQTAYTQPALFAIEYALAQLWQSWGIKPDAVMGHSIGEYVAATIAGIFSLEDGLKLVANRGRLMQNLPSQGQMISVMASESKVTAIIHPYLEKVSIAAINGAESVVISGEAKAIQEIVRTLELENIKTKALKVSHAFHSPLMKPMLIEFEKLASQVTYNQPLIPIISNLTGVAADNQITTANYWVNHIIKPVKFAQSVDFLHQKDYNIFLEIGAKPILLGMISQQISDKQNVYLPSLNPARGEWQQILSSLGELYARGANINWSGFEQDYIRQKIALPNYPFQQESYWLEIDKIEPENYYSSPDKNGLELITKWLYEIEWQPKPRFSKLSPPDYLLIPQEIKEQLSSTVTALVNQIDNDQYKKFQNELEQLSLDYIVQALKELGWSYKQEESFSFDQAVQNLNIIPNQLRLFKRIMQILGEEKIVQLNDSDYVLKKEIKAVNPQQKHEFLLTQYPNEVAALTLLHSCASQLDQILQGKIDPIQLLFPEGDLSITTQFYQDSPIAKVMNTLVQKAITKAMQRLPKSRGIRFLEIGAGTGSITSLILPHINPHQAEYVFTDIGSLFISKAQEKFSNYSFVSYKSLDIEIDPINQGFDPHQYDVIIAGNVLHATTNLQQTLAHLRKLLVPEGILVLLEGTTPTRWIDLIFGLLEGWWRFKDLELRPDYPLLNSAKWKQFLTENGFSQVVALPEAVEEVPEILHQQALIVAKAEPSTTEPPTTSKTWLIFADRDGITEELSRQLSLKEEYFILVFAGEKYQQVGVREFIINPKIATDYTKIFTTAITDSSSSIEILYLWGLNLPNVQQLTTENLESISDLGCGAILLMVQALVNTEFVEKTHLWLVTQGTQPVEGINSYIPGLTQSPLWGMGRVISLEYPQLWGGMIDLEPHSSVDVSASLLILEVLAVDSEDHIAFRNEKRYVARLINSKNIPKSPNFQFKYQSHGTYLITGGLGFLGLKLAEYIAQQGAGHIVLLGRTGLPTIPENSETNQKRATIKMLEKSGTKVTVLAADVTNLVQMSLVIEQINSTEQPLKGIIHAAGIGSGLLIKDLNIETFVAVLRPKTIGTWILHELTKNLDLDCFICFSSAGSVWGAKRQADYDAANHFLDTFAYYRRSIGLPALSVNWGSLGVGGMVSEEFYIEWMNQIGLEALQPEQGFNALNFLLQTNAVQAVVAQVNWQKFKEIYNLQKSRMLLEAIEHKNAELPNQLLQQKHKVLQQLEMAFASERYQILITYIQEQVAKLLGIKDSTILSPEQGLIEMGMDSLTAVELRNKLQIDLSCSLPITLAFEFPTIAKLAEYIDSQVLGSELENKIAGEKKTNILSAVEELTEQEVEDLIAQELADLNILLEDN